MNCKKCNKIIGHPDTKCTPDLCDIKEWCDCCDDIIKNKLKNLEDAKNNHIAYKRPYKSRLYENSKTVREICYYMNGIPYDVICKEHYDKSNFIYCKCKAPLKQFDDYSQCTENWCYKDHSVLENTGVDSGTDDECCCGECYYGLFDEQKCSVSNKN